MKRKKHGHPCSIHGAAVTLGRRGGKATAAKRRSRRRRK